MLWGGVAACHRYGVCTVRWCGSMSWVWCVYCAVVWRHVVGMVCVLCGGVAACRMYGVCVCVCLLCGGVAACHRYGVCTVRWCGSMS